MGTLHPRLVCSQRLSSRCPLLADLASRFDLNIVYRQASMTDNPAATQCAVESSTTKPTLPAHPKVHQLCTLCYPLNNSTLILDTERPISPFGFIEPNERNFEQTGRKCDDFPGAVLCGIPLHSTRVFFYLRHTSLALVP